MSIAFELTGQPFFGAASLWLSTDMGIYPPLSVLRWLSEGFKKYAFDQESLEKAFEISHGKKTQPIDTAEQEAYILGVMNEIFELILKLDITANDAVDMVNARLAQSNEARLSEENGKEILERNTW